MLTTSATATAAAAAGMLAASTLVAAVPLDQQQHQTQPRRISLPVYKFDRHAARHAKRGTPEAVEATLAHYRSQQEYIRNKYGGTGTNSTSRASKRQSTALTDVGTDSYYYAPVGFGTPAQTLAVVLDTGSSDLWVASNECTSDACSELAKFNTGASSSFQTSNQPFSVQYGSGATKGHLAADTVQLADYSVQHQTFALATDMAAHTLDAPASGLMGLGLQQLSSAGVTPFWEVLARQNVLSQPVFSLQLARNTNPTSATSEAPGGVFTLGELDSSQYSGDIHWIDLDPQQQQLGYWGIELSAMQLNGGNNVTFNGQTAIPDSGTSLIGAPTQVATALYEKIPGAQNFGSPDEGMFVFPCNEKVHLSFTFDGQQYSIAPEDFNAGTVDNQGSMCLGAVFGMDNQGPMPKFICGDSLMKSYFTAFKLSKGSNPAQVGFASLKNGDNAQTLKATATFVTATEATGASSPSSSVGNGGNLPPWLTSAVGNSQATGTQIYYGSGLSSPIGSGSRGVASIQTGSSGGHSPAGPRASVSKYVALGSALTASVLASMAWVL